MDWIRKKPGASDWLGVFFVPSVSLDYGRDKLMNFEELLQKLLHDIKEIIDEIDTMLGDDPKEQ